MSLTTALQNALSGLQTAQANIQVISNNVTNANTEGYTRKIVQQTSRVLAGEGRGVELGDITRIVDQRILSDLRSNLGSLGESSVQEFYYTRVLDQFGTLSNNDSIGADIADLSSALQNLAASPESSANRTEVILTAAALAEKLNNMSTQIQALRLDADREIATKIESVNSELETIAVLNEKIEIRVAIGESVAELEDLRDQAINNITEIIDVRYFERTTGVIVLTLPDGRLLADENAKTIEHTQAGAISADISYPDDGINGILANGVDITDSIDSGEIKGLIDMRDSILPDLQEQIDKLSQMLRDEVNAIHNAGSGLPPANSLTGTRDFDDPTTDSITITSAVRIAVVDENGDYVAYHDIAAGTYTIEEIEDEIDTNLAGSASATTGADDPLTITASDSTYGIAIVDLGDQTVTHTDGTTTYEGFSNYFGLNDFFITSGKVQGDSNTGLASLITVRSDIESDPSHLSRGALDSTTSPAPAAGDTAISLGDSSVIQAIADIFLEDLSYEATGGLPLVTATFAGYASEIISANAVAAAMAENDAVFRTTLVEDLSFRNQSISGVNMDEELKNMILYENAYAATARIVQVVDTLFEILINLGR